MHLVFHWFVSKGTLLEQPTLYEDDISTPENLQRYTIFLRLCTAQLHKCQSLKLIWRSTLSSLCRTLETEDLRKRYISPPVPADDRPLVYPETDQPWIGRRIDYILYRENSISKHCRTVCAPVCFYSFFYSVFSFFSIASVSLKLQVTLRCHK